MDALRRSCRAERILSPMGLTELRQHCGKKESHGLKEGSPIAV